MEQVGIRTGLSVRFNLTWQSTLILVYLNLEEQLKTGGYGGKTDPSRRTFGSLRGRRAYVAVVGFLFTTIFISENLLADADIFSIIY